MVNPLNAAGYENLQAGNFSQPARIMPQEIAARPPKDLLQLGKGGKVSDEQAMGVVLERAYSKLQEVVGQARTDLGLEEGAELDLSPEATAGRIADFALSHFEQYAENNGLENNEEGRKQFADFIGQAITKGVDEARGILGSLNALNSDIETNIDNTASLVQERLDNFVANGLSE
jgi:hypothetical protein